MPVPNQIFFFGGSGNAFGTWYPTGGSAAGRAAMLALDPTLGNITIQGDQYQNDNGSGGSFLVHGVGGFLYLTDNVGSDSMGIPTGTTVLDIGDVGYPDVGFAPRPGSYGSVIYWGSGTSGGIQTPPGNDFGDYRTSGLLTLVNGPCPDGYWIDIDGNPWPLPITGYPPGTYIDPVTHVPIVPTILFDPYFPPPPKFNPTPPAGTDGLFTSNPPGTINWSLHRCDMKPRQEEKA